MSHDIGFYDLDTYNEKDPDKIEVITYFFGYAGGIFYEAFDATEFDMGVSGSNQGVTRTAELLRQGIELIKASPVYTNYPDPDRIPATIRDLEAFLERKPNGRVFIHYS